MLYLLEPYMFNVLILYYFNILYDENAINCVKSYILYIQIWSNQFYSLSTLVVFSILSKHDI